MTKLTANPGIKRLGVPVAARGVPPAGRKALLELYPDARFNPSPAALDEDGMIEFLRGCDAAIIGLDPLSARVIDALPELKIVGKFGAGYDTVDFEALKRKGILFGYAWGVNALPVAEMALSFMISALRLFTPLNQAMRDGERPLLTMGRMLTGRTVGIHGCGHIGQELVRLLKPFKCEVLACDIRDRSAFYRENGVTAVDFPTLLERSEVLTLHLSKSKATTGLYDRAALERMRPDAVLVNTCRGGIVDEDALLDQLEKGALTGACFDVFAIEPASNDRLLQHRRMLATPHIGAAIDEVRVAMFEAAIAALVDNGPVDLSAYDI